MPTELPTRRNKASESAAQISDLARAAAFYRETLGLTQEIYSEEWKWAEFNCGNVTFALNGGVNLPEAIVGGRIALAVDDVFAACEELTWFAILAVVPFWSDHRNDLTAKQMGELRRHK